MPFILKRRKTMKDIEPQLIEDIINELKKSMVVSDCPNGCLRIENIYWNPSTEEIVIETEDE